MGSLFQASESAENWDENCASVHIGRMIVPRERQQMLILCFAKKALERMFHVLVSHANAQAIRGRPTSKDDERFPNGSRSVHEFHSLKAGAENVEKIEYLRCRKN